MRRWARRLGLLLLCGLAGGEPGQAQALAAAPLLTAISPNNGPEAAGSTVTIGGSGFTPGSTVRFGQALATSVKVDSPTSIAATSPAGSGTVDVSVTNASGTSTPVPSDQFAYDPPPSPEWLGLNGNNTTYVGPVRAFVEHGVVYDRSGPVDWTAGELLEEGGRPTPGARALATDIANGMIPVITIEYRGFEGEYKSDPRFPTEAGGSRALTEYVEGFVKSAQAVLAAYPATPILFEPINEPWGYTTPQFNAAQYADIIARLLPAARIAGMPLSRIYVAGYGKAWIPQMYAAQPSLQTEVQGWYLHPYGPPSGSFEQNSQGIQSLPRAQREMTSGQNNIIVSEAGFCALDVNGGRGCGWPYLAHSSEAAQELTEMLQNALPYHESGWLRALLVYSRNDGGWAMQLPHGALTAAGEALRAFADDEHRPLSFLPFGSPAGDPNPFEPLERYAWLVRLGV